MRRISFSREWRDFTTNSGPGFLLTHMKNPRNHSHKQLSCKRSAILCTYNELSSLRLILGVLVRSFRPTDISPGKVGVVVLKYDNVLLVRYELFTRRLRLILFSYLKGPVHCFSGESCDSVADNSFSPNSRPSFFSSSLRN